MRTYNNYKAFCLKYWGDFEPVWYWWHLKEKAYDYLKHIYYHNLYQWDYKWSVPLQIWWSWQKHKWSHFFSIRLWYLKYSEAEPYRTIRYVVAKPGIFMRGH